MIIKLTTPLIILFVFFNLNAQNSEIENNIIKYWNYRNRLLSDFVAVGAKPGQSLPFATRNENGLKVLDHGQGPMVLGQYIGVLATEYKLLHQNNQNTEQTLKELFYALYAFNRLDLIAETVNGYNKKPKLDGFFIREDFPDDFVEQNPSFNKNSNGITGFILGSGKSFDVKCTTFKGTYRCGTYVDKDCNVKGKPKGYSSKYNHKPPSLDQFLGVLLGLSLVNNFVDDDAKYLDKKFQDNESLIKKEAQNIAKRMVSYAKKYHWTPKEPDGDYMGDCDFTTKKKPNYFKNNSTMLYFARFISNIGNTIYGKKYGYPPLVDAFDGMATIFSNFKDGYFYNLRMYIEVITLSNKNNALFTSTAKRVKQISKIYDWEAFYYTLGLSLHGWKRDNEIVNKSQTMLNSAPFEGPFFHSVDDFAKGGWASENRFSASVGEQFKGSRFPKISGNYSGLDYMLMHNLHLLSYLTLEETTQYGMLKRNNKEYEQTTIVRLDARTCYKAEKQSCNERYARYKFFYKLSVKNCSRSKSECKKSAIKYINQKFSTNFNPNKKGCKKNVINQKCNIN